MRCNVYIRSGWRDTAWCMTWLVKFWCHICSQDTCYHGCQQTHLVHSSCKRFSKLVTKQELAQLFANSQNFQISTSSQAQFSFYVFSVHIKCAKRLSATSSTSATIHLDHKMSSRSACPKLRPHTLQNLSKHVLQNWQHKKLLLCSDGTTLHIVIFSDCLKSPWLRYIHLQCITSHLSSLFCYRYPRPSSCQGQRSEQTFCL